MFSSVDRRLLETVVGGIRRTSTSSIVCAVNCTSVATNEHTTSCFMERWSNGLWFVFHCSVSDRAFMSFHELNELPVDTQRLLSAVYNTLALFIVCFGDDCMFWLFQCCRDRRVFNGSMTFVKNRETEIVATIAKTPQCSSVYCAFLLWFTSFQWKNILFSSKYLITSPSGANRCVSVRRPTSLDVISVKQKRYELFWSYGSVSRSETTHETLGINAKASWKSVKLTLNLRFNVGFWQDL